MKGLFLLVLIMAISACTTREKGISLEKDTPEYQLAASFAEKVPEFNPDDNMVLLTSDKYEVTVGDVIERIRARFGNRTSQIVQSPTSQIIRLYKEVAQSVAYSKVMTDEAAKLGIEVSDAHIDSILQAQYNRVGGKEKYIEFLTQNGATLETLRSDIRIGETQRLYIEKVRAEKEAVSEDEIETAINGDRYASVQHILLMTQSMSDSAKAATRDKMQGILDRAKAGEDFGELAKEFTEDPGSKNNGGLYENFEKGKMVPEFEEASFNIPVGEISDIVETQYGYHIIKVVERKKEDRPREEVEKMLKQNKKRSAEKLIFDEISEDNNFVLAEIKTK